MLSIEVQRRILSVVLESIKMEDPEYINDITLKITRATCDLIEKKMKFPEKEEFLRKCTQISTKFFRFNKINRKDFFNDLYERFMLFEINLHEPNKDQSIDWNLILEEIGLTQDIQQKLLLELNNLRKEYVESVNDIMKSLLQVKTKIAVSGIELEKLRLNLESLILILKIKERDKQGFLNRLRIWGSEVGLGVVGNYLYDVLILVGKGG